MPAKHTVLTSWESQEEIDDAKAKAAERQISLSKLIRQQIKKLPHLKQ